MTHEVGDLRPVVVVGAGGHACVLLDALHLLSRRVLFVTDRDTARHGHHLGQAEIRSDEEILKLQPANVCLVNAVGSVATMASRRSVFEKFVKLGYQFATVVHPSAVVSTGAMLCDGVQVMAGAIIQTGVVIGVNALVNTRASVDHDCRIGAHSHIAPGATLSGGAFIGDCTHIGTSAVIIQGIKIGSEALIGAGAVVLQDVPQGSRVAGIPAKAMHKRSTTNSALPAMAIMLSAAGRRTALLKLVQESVSQAGFAPRIITTDINQLGAAFHLGDRKFVVPRYSESNCLAHILGLCREHDIRLILPTIDPDLPFYAEHREAFAAVGTQIMVSSPETIRICSDKRLTHEWLASCGLPVLRQVEAKDFVPADWAFPLFVKPRNGSSSIGTRKVQSAEEMRWAITDKSYVIEELAVGREYTVDVYVDRFGKCRCAVPRLRIETRGGEVTKAMTVRCAILEKMAGRVAECLPGARGILNIQLFYDGGGHLTVSEINARLGGGYPLTHQAGAPMVRWAIEEMAGREPSIQADLWTDGLTMLRYDDAIFVSAQEAGVASLRPAESP